MRIIGGEHRGRRIKMPGGADVRPTQDRVREAIFNVIAEKVPKSNVLDLYAGSGAFGIEALSRGALSAVFVDVDIACVRAISDNLAIFGKRKKMAQVLKMEAIRAISRFQKEGRKFELVFLDPPYHKGGFNGSGTVHGPRRAAESPAKNSLIKMSACDILSQHAFIIAEHFEKDVLPREMGGIVLFKEKRYGDTVVSFYRKK